MFFKYNKMFKEKGGEAGFSLIEVLVSMTVFMFVATASVGVLLVMIDANRKAQNVQSVMTNLSFALDSMTREIRTGTHYYCGWVSQLNNPISPNATRDCVNSGGLPALSFNEASGNLTSAPGCTGRRIAYRFVENPGVIERRLCDNGDWLPITAPEVTITDFGFYVTGTNSYTGSADTASPLVTIYIEGQTERGARDTDTSFSLQTTVAQYTLDI